MDSPRVLPHHLPSETSLLGALLIDKSGAVYQQIAPLIQSFEFYRLAHRRIYQAISSLHQSGVSVDLVTVCEYLDRKMWIDDPCGGPAYVASLVDGVPHSTNARYYANIVTEKATLRTLIRAGTALVEDAYAAQQSAKEIILTAEQQLSAILNASPEGNMADLSAGTLALSHDLDFRMRNKGAVTGVPTGFKGIDTLTLGWQPGDLIIVGARTSIGKSSFAVNTAVAAAQAGKRAAIFSLEMGRQQIEYRILSQLSQVPLTRMKHGAVPDHEMQAKIGPALQQMHDLPIEIDDTAGRSGWSIRAACRQMHTLRPLSLVIVDFVQLTVPTEAEKDLRRDQQIGECVKLLKAMGKDLGVPVIVLSQIRRGEGRPRKDDLRDAGNLEEFADVVLLLHRAKSRDSGKTEAIFDKQRDGNGGVLYLSLDRDTVTFSDMPYAVEDEATPEPSKPRAKKYARPHVTGREW